MTKWLTDIQTGLRLGVLFIAVILLVDGGLLAWIAAQPVSIRTFMVGLVSLASVALIGLLVYWLNGLLRSGYTLDRNAFTITWGANEQTIPTPQIERVVLGEELDSRAFHFRGVSWPGHWVGYGAVQDLGSTLFYATVPPKKQVYLVTPAVVYGVSPEDRAGFLHALQIRMQMGPTQAVEQASLGPAFLTWGFWRDRLGLGLLIGALALVLALTGFICARFAALPRLLPLHFDAAGAPDRLGPQGQIFFLPLIGLVTWVANGILGGLFYRHERLASYLLWSGAVVVQVLFWVAVLGILKAA